MSNCTCTLGGPICGVCRGREALYKRIKDLEALVKSLTERVEWLERNSR